MKTKIIAKIGAVSLAVMVTGGCSDFFNPVTGTTLPESANYQRSEQVKSNFIGVAASFKQIAENWVVLAELRGDLVTPSMSATQDIWDVFNYETGPNNSLVDPAIYYRAIINCNDFIRHAVAYDLKYPGVLATDQIRGMIADALRFRAWSYLTLGKLYGEAIYFDIAIVDDVDILENPDDWRSDMDSLYFGDYPAYDPDSQAPRDPNAVAVRMGLSDLIDELIANLNVGVKGYSGLAVFNWAGLANSTDNSWNQLGINPNALMGELYMWKAAFNRDQERQWYQKALDYLIRIPNNVGVISNPAGQTIANTSNFTLNVGYSNFSTGTNPGNMNEVITYMPFDLLYQQTNKLAEIFYTYLEPNEVLIGLYDNTPRSITDGGVGDVTRKTMNVNVSMGNNRISKYISPSCPVIVYRAGEIHLMIAECLNHMLMFNEAATFLGSGMSQHWNAGSFFNYPFSNPIFSTNLRTSRGVRGRVGLGQYWFLTSGTTAVIGAPTVADGVLTYDTTNWSDDQRIDFIDSLIMDEYAMELPFEGKRYFALLRQAIMKDDTEYFAETLSRKFEVPGLYKTTLLDRKNWFLDYDQTEI